MLCRIDALSANQAKAFKAKVEDEYRVNMCVTFCRARSLASAPYNATLVCRILDNLPVAIARVRDDNGMPLKTYDRGFPVGRQEVYTGTTAGCSS